MKLYGKIISDSKIVREAISQNNDESASFRDRLEACLITNCKELDIQVPLWLNKNSNEFLAFHRTSFGKEQFLESIKFDKFEIKLEL